MYPEPAPFPFAHLCLAIITICIIFITAYLVVVLKRVNRILGDIEEITKRTKPIVKGFDAVVSLVGKVGGFFHRKRNRTESEE